jgi:hypothetical protein
MCKDMTREIIFLQKNQRTGPALDTINACNGTGCVRGVKIRIKFDQSLAIANYLLLREKKMLRCYST